MFVKICGTTTEEDALLAVAMGADAVGFIFAPSTRQVQATRVRDIVTRLPREILTVGVFRDAAPEQVLDIYQECRLTGVQLHGHETIEESQWLSQRVEFLIQALPAGSPELAHVDDYAAKGGYEPAYGPSLVLLNPREHVFLPFHGPHWKYGVRFLQFLRSESK